MCFSRYLKKYYRSDTIIFYTREINRYLEYEPEAEKANYTDILHYLGILRQQRSGKSKLQGTLQAIKQYYHYLLQSGKRKDHPCRYLVLKDKIGKSIQLQDLFTTGELETLMERKERYKIMELRNKVLISLLIYQGLTTGEVIQLGYSDINLEQGTIYIKGTTLTQSRTIGLRTNQIMLLHQYLKEIRPKLLSRNKKNVKSKNFITTLLLTWRGSAESGEGVHYLISTYKKHFMGRNLNPKTIRQSVITNLLKQGKDVRLVQEYVGHKSPDTTEKYKQSDTEALQHAIHKYHPLR